jgi:hypothetical protein
MNRRKCVLCNRPPTRWADQCVWHVMWRLETIMSCIVATVVMRDLDTWDSFYMNSFNIWDIPLWDVLSRLCSPLRRFVAGSTVTGVVSLEQVLWVHGKWSCYFSFAVKLSALTNVLYITHCTQESNRTSNWIVAKALNLLFDCTQLTNLFPLD